MEAQRSPDLSTGTEPNSAAAPRPSVIGVGASAGGVAALKEFFGEIPEDSGLVFVVVVHLSPDHESHLDTLLQPFCRIPVQQVKSTVPLEPNNVYIIPPGANLSAVDTHLRLTELEESRRERAPIDHFFRTLATTHDGHSIGVILTGSGSDGSLGIREVKGQGGLTIVQDPKEAEYDGMPQSAISTGAVDLILPLAEIPGAILSASRVAPRVVLPAAENDEGDQGRLVRKILLQIRARTGFDFTRYKTSTVLRRIQRRMQLRQIEELAAYLERLRADQEETVSLANDMLITVTNFFRDEEVWKAVAAGLIPYLFDAKSATETIRVWSVGCATGEEAYSLAIMLKEESRRRTDPPAIQVFASDLHEHSLDRAREGFYPGDIEADVSEERLSRFFQKEDGGYRISREIREMVVFAPHDLLSDPPFSRLDLIVCRNVLIYLQRSIQEEVIDLFHYALRPGGTLILGSSETLDQSELFTTEDKTLRFYRKRNVPPREPRLPVFPVNRARGIHEPPQTQHPEEPSPGYGALHHQMVERYSLPSILVSGDHRVVHLSENAGRYLLLSGGEPSTNIFKMVRQELRIDLRAALATARDKGRPTRTRPTPVDLDGEVVHVAMNVRPSEDASLDGYCLVIFDEIREPADGSVVRDESQRVESEMETELHLARQRLQSIIEEYETSQEEMRASHEELQSANEELRSTMEELETSKEELQSMNEELQTVNQENRHKVDELSQLSSDLQNLMAATEIATLFLDRDLRILRFTPQIEDLFSIRAVDRGRPVSDLTHRLAYDELEKDAAQVLRRLTPIDREIHDEAGRWYLTRVLPYRSAQDRIGGVVITFIDITERKLAEEQLRSSEILYRALIEASTQIVWTTDSSGRVEEDSASWREHTGQTFEQMSGDGWLDAVHPADRDRVRRHWQEGVDDESQIILGFRLWSAAKKGWGEASVRAVPLRDEYGRARGWVAMNIDVTDQRQAEEAARHSENRYRLLFESIDQGFCLAEIDPGLEGSVLDFRLLEVNEAFTSQTGLEDVVGRTVRELLPGAEPDCLRFLEQVATSQESVRIEIESETLGRWFEVFAFPIPDLGTRQVGVLFEDVTERKAAHSRLLAASEAAEAASRAKSQFLAVMSHELRTPLTGVIGYADLMETEVMGPMTDRQREALSRIQSSSWHLVSIIDEILTLSRADAGKEEIHWGEIGLAGVIQDVVDALVPTAETKGLRLQFDAPDDPVLIVSDSGKVRQILTNLIGNAIKYTDEGSVEIQIERTEENVSVHVRDTGVGIAEEHLETVFEAFTQVDLSHKRRNPGTGLGLAICRRLAVLMGGAVTVQSQVDDGSVFTLVLPLQENLSSSPEMETEGAAR